MEETGRGSTEEVETEAHLQWTVGPGHEAKVGKDTWRGWGEKERHRQVSPPRPE